MEEGGSCKGEYGQNATTAHFAQRRKRGQLPSGIATTYARGQEGQRVKLRWKVQEGKV